MLAAGRSLGRGKLALQIITLPGNVFLNFFFYVHFLL
jgi:hypothetical protein